MGEAHGRGITYVTLASGWTPVPVAHGWRAEGTARRFRAWIRSVLSLGRRTGAQPSTSRPRRTRIVRVGHGKCVLGWMVVSMNPDRAARLPPALICRCSSISPTLWLGSSPGAGRRRYAKKLRWPTRAVPNSQPGPSVYIRTSLNDAGHPSRPFRNLVVTTPYSVSSTSPCVHRMAHHTTHV
jgi:hypothetical protein